MFHKQQCVQAAISQQVEDLAKQFPNKRVALITFNQYVFFSLFMFVFSHSFLCFCFFPLSEVTVYKDDGTTEVIAGDKLQSRFEKINMNELKNKTNMN